MSITNLHHTMAVKLADRHVHKLDAIRRKTGMTKSDALRLIIDAFDQAGEVKVFPVHGKKVGDATD